MGKIARFVGNLVAFASNSTGTERTVFGDVAQSDVLTANINADFKAGWEDGLDLNGFPSQQFFNAIGFTATQLSAYLHQMGIAEYDSAKEYHIGSFCNSSGVLYSSLTNNNVGNAVTDTVNWKKQDSSALLGGATETELTINSGSVTPTQANHNVDNEADAASDDLTNIVTTNIIDSGLLMIRPNNAARTVVVKDVAGGAGQIHTLSGADVTLDDTFRVMLLQRRGADWYEIYSSVAVDSTQIIRGHISGLLCTNGTDTDHDIDISVGDAVDSSDTYLMQLSSGLVKQIDAVWAAGTNQGGLFTGSVANDTTYYTFLIRKDSDGTLDAGFDTSATAANIPAGYTAYRMIDKFVTDGSANILNWSVAEVAGNLVKEYIAIISDFSGAPSTGSKTTTAMTVPTGDNILVNFSANYNYSAGLGYAWVRSTGFTDVAASITVCTHSTEGESVFSRVDLTIKTDASAQISHRATNAGLMQLNTLGYTVIRH